MKLRIKSSRKLTLIALLLTSYITFRFFIPPSLEGILSPTNLALAFSIQILGWKIIVGLTSLFATVNLIPVLGNLVFVRESSVMLAQVFVDPRALEALETKGLHLSMDSLIYPAIFFSFVMAYAIRPLIVHSLKKYIVKDIRF